MEQKNEGGEGEGGHQTCEGEMGKVRGGRSYARNKEKTRCGGKYQVHTGGTVFQAIWTP